MFIARPAAEIEPDSSMSSSKRILPGPTAPRLERSMRTVNLAIAVAYHHEGASSMTRWLLRVMVTVMAVSGVRPAAAEDLVLFGAGSLRESMTQIARDFQT